ncbi:hypothetical protein B0H67DRAFT_491123 [Lasiosphaeris hirsuta]|uniref:Rho-GAP domain-containing protein n=1 Tax=Lasiosphaeris hirsuta TaxID=260670 RepID=A0AA40DSD9_9PEZI|nr:hypothetical protein B0H67DRAFT_491123 [Lasiosphaeris hirsuta]
MLAAAASPQNKRDHKSWWKGFKLAPKHQEAHGTAAPSTRSRPCRARSLFVEDLDGHLAELSSSVSFLYDICAEEANHRAHQASASLMSQASTSRPPERPKLDTIARILTWRLRRCAGGRFSSQCPPGKRLIAADIRPQGIFGVPLRQSITYANVAISLVDESGKSYIYGYVPIVVAKCGVFLKEKATEVEGIFRLSGSEKRIKELKTIFDSPDRYGKGLVWDGYTVHDAANVLRRYLNDLPEPVVPLDLYEKFREPLRGATKPASGDGEGPQFVESFDMDDAIREYQQLITELPPLNRQLLLYILDLLAVFAAKSDQNRMNSQNLAAIFQPGMLSHPNHAMAPEEYRLNQCVIIFLIENQDHFLIGMQGTAADEKTVREVQKGAGTPVIKTPTTPAPNRSSVITRSSSNASAGAENVAKDGQIRRNKSTSSRRSLHSNGAPSPGSPAVVTTPTSGLARSNTVPSKRSPALQGGRFGTRGEAPVTPLTPVAPQATEIVSHPAVVHEVATPPEERPAPSVPASTASTATSSLLPVQSVSAGRSQETLVESTAEAASTPSRERRLPIMFSRSATAESEGRQSNKQPNKLRKKKMPGSTNPSAHSSTASLPHSAAASPHVEAPNPLESIPPVPKVPNPDSLPRTPTTETFDTAPRPSQPPPNNGLRAHRVEATLRPKNSPPTSLHSSFNEGSDLDQVEELPVGGASESGSPDTQQEKDKKKRWRLSRKRDDAAPTSHPSSISPRKILGSNSNAEASTSTVSSSGKPPHSMTGESSDLVMVGSEAPSGYESAGKENKDDTKSLTGWIKHKYREHKETVERRNKSPPADRSVSLGGSFLHGRGKSLDLKRAYSNEKPPVPQIPQAQTMPQPQAPPQTQTQTQTPEPFAPQ